MDYKTFFKIINGNFDKVPKDKPKQVRIFLSSTFSDTHTERDYLIANIYPLIKTYCKTKYNLDFQILDMRWGIGNECMNTHMATSICLNEIKICQNNSIGPNFIALLSHRYGSRGLPTRIISAEYKILQNEIHNQKIDNSFEFVSDEDTIKFDNLFEDCYELDENEKPARYRLKYLNKLFPNINQKDPNFSKLWSQVESKLGNIFRSVAQVCYKKELINKTQYERYFVSVTEKEIFNGILKAKNVDSNVLYFEREIEDIDVRGNPKLAGRFIDLKNDEIDTDAKNLLDKLKYQKIQSSLSSKNIFKFKVKWDNQIGISLETHEEYIKNFGKTFYDQVIKLIDRNQIIDAKKNVLNEADSELIREVLDHARFCKEKVSQFHGRKQLLDQLMEYVLSDNNAPFLVYGESGCGKTAILAKLADEISKVVSDPENYTIILRFLGTTPSTSIINRTLVSIIYQVSRIYNITLPDINMRMLTKIQLKEIFHEQLLYIGERYPNRKTILILDSIDQLNSMDYDLEWVLEVLPCNVKMLYSVIGSHESILNTFENAIGLPKENIIEIHNLDLKLCNEIIQDWLIKANRSISTYQWSVIERMFKKATLFPLYLKLVFDIISRWTSFHEPDADFVKCTNIDKCIKYLFNFFEKEHGYLLFSRSVIYMSSFVNGISENEIEDILSLDDDVLYDIFEFHAPPVRKLPVALWSRIKHDLKGYMVEKEVEDTRVIYWYHRRFIEVAESHYIKSLNKDVFLNVIDFYNETWKYKPKPYAYNSYVAAKKKVGKEKLQETRETSVQPTVFIDNTGKVRFNSRKISEFPAFISKLKPNVSAPLACEYIYFDYNFMTGLYAISETDEIFNQLKSFKKTGTYKNTDEASRAFDEIEIAKLIFIQCAFAMKDYPFSACGQLVSRVLCFFGHQKYITNLVYQYDRESYKNCALIVPYQFLPEPGSSVIFTYEKHTKPITCTAIGGDQDGFVFTLSDKLNLLNVTDLKTKNQNNIVIENKNQSFIFMIIYCNEKLDNSINSFSEINGGFLVATENMILSYSFQNTLYFKKRFNDYDDQDIITNICLVSSNHVVVSFLGKNYFDIYNIFSGEFIHRKIFEKNILFIVNNTHKQQVNFTSFFEETQSFIAVVLESSELLVFSLENSEESESSYLRFKSNKCNQIILKQVFHMADSGFKCHSIIIDIDKSKDSVGKKSFKPDCIILTLENASFIKIKFYSKVVNQRLEFKVSEDIEYFKSEQVVSRENHLIIKNRSNLRIRSNQSFIYDFFFFIGTDCHIYIFYTNDEKYGMIEIPGEFNDVIILPWNSKADQSYMSESLMLATFYEGIIGYYFVQFDVDNNNYRYVKVSETPVHYEMITFYFVKDHMIMTTSLDNSLKISTVDTDIERTEIHFDRTQKDITKLSLIGDNFVLAQTNKTEQLSKWDLSTGSIVSHIKLDTIEYIEDHILVGSKLIIISVRFENKTLESSYIIRGYSLSEKSELNFLEDFKMALPKRKQLKTIAIKTEDDLKFFILNEYIEKSCLDLYELSYNRLEIQSVIDGAIKKSLIDLEPFVTRSNNLLENPCEITCKEHLIILCLESQILVIDTQTQKVLKHKIDSNTNTINYFLSPTNLSLKNYKILKVVEKTDNFIAIDNLNNLNYIVYSKVLNSLEITTSSNFFFNSFRIKNGILIAYDSENEKIIGYDLMSLSQYSNKNIFKYPIFSLDLKNYEEIYDYGLNSDCKYLYAIVNKKHLIFYRLSDFKKIADFTLYSKPRYVVCSKEYICIAMSDKKIISFLICDPSLPVPIEKIKNLKSRAIPENGSEKQKLQEKLVIKSGTLFQNSGSIKTKDKFIGVFELEQKVNSIADNNSTIKKKDITNYDIIRTNIKKSNITNILYEKITNEYISVSGWEINLLEKNSWLKQEIIKQIRIDNKSKCESCEIEEDNLVYEGAIEAFKRNLEKSKSNLTFKNVRKSTLVTNNTNVQNSAACSVQ